MRPKSLALLLLALGCGLVASIGITKVMTKGSGDADGAGGEATGIFVAATDIAMGDLLTPNVVKLEPWKNAIPTGALSRTEDIENRRARTKLYAGEPILENRLFGKGASQQGATAMIPKGYRVVPVKVDLVSGGSSLILPGDRVDVMIHLVCDPSRGIYETVTRTILQDIKVFAVNDVMDFEKDKDGGKSIAAKTICLLVTPEQAAKVMLAAQMGVVNLVMRSSEEDKNAADVEARPGQLMGATHGSQQDRDGGQFPPIVKGPVAIVAPPPVETPKLRSTWTMQVIKGNTVEPVVLEEQPSGLWKVAPATTGAAGSPPKDEPIIAAPPLVHEPSGPVKPDQPPKLPKKTAKQNQAFKLPKGGDNGPS